MWDPVQNLGVGPTSRLRGATPLTENGCRRRWRAVRFAAGAASKNGWIKKMSMNVSRRSVAKGAAWSVPVVTLATAAPAIASTPADCMLVTQATDICTAIGSNGEKPWLAVNGGPTVAPTYSAPYGNNTAWDPTKGLTSWLYFNGRLFNNATNMDPGGGYRNMLGVTLWWEFTMTVPTANTANYQTLTLGKAGDSCGRSVAGDGMFGNPVLSGPTWVNNGDGTSTGTFNVVMNGTNSSMNPQSDIYLSVTLQFRLPVLPGQTVQVGVMEPKVNCEDKTAPQQYGADVTWFADNDPAKYRYGAWFRGSELGTDPLPNSIDYIDNASAPYSTTIIGYTN